MMNEKIALITGAARGIGRAIAVALATEKWRVVVNYRCEFASGIGYRGIEVAPFTLAERPERITPQQRAALRESAESRGLEIIGLH